jgi:hypothetical protein
LVVVQEKERHIFYSSIQGVSKEICRTSGERSCVKYNQSNFIDTTKVRTSKAENIYGNKGEICFKE